MQDAIIGDLKKSIEQNLPAGVGEVLRKRLEQAESAERELAMYKEQSNTAHETHKKLTEELRRAREEIAAHVKLDERKAAVEKLERNIELTRLTCSLEAEKRVTAGYAEMLKGLVRNVDFRSSFYESSNRQVLQGIGGGYMSCLPESRSVTEERKAE